MERQFCFKLISLILVVFCLPQFCRADNDFNLDGIIAGMTSGMSSRPSSGQSSGPNFDNMISAMSNGKSAAATKSNSANTRSIPDFDSMLSAMGSNDARSSRDSYSSIADMMTVNSTLDYLNGVYSAPLPSYNYNSNSYARPANYRHLVPGSAQLPISGRLTSGYGYRPRFGRMHKGVDIALNVGDTVVAAIEGTVTRVSNDPRGYGLFVCIRHDNGVETRYAHLSRQLVSPGMRVYAGYPIGLGGSTGNSTGPHLHFETRVEGSAVDPTTMFDFSMPGGYMPYRTLSELDNRNPRVASNRSETLTATALQSVQTANIANGNRATYVVRNGDTIASIARNNGISVLTLCRLNMLNTTDQLQPGRMLKLR